MADGKVSLASGGFTLPNRAEVFLFHEVALASGEVGIGIFKGLFDWIAKYQSPR